MYLLDTNVCVQYLRGKNAHVRNRLAITPSNDLHLCAPVIAELFYGCLRSAKPSENRADVDTFIRPYLCLPLDDAAADIFSQIRYDLEIKGNLIGPYDLQIAAIALAHGLTLVTHNTAEFSRVPKLPYEDWEQP